MLRQTKRRHVNEHCSVCLSKKSKVSESNIHKIRQPCAQLPPAHNRTCSHSWSDRQSRVHKRQSSTSHSSHTQAVARREPGTRQTRRAAAVVPGVRASRACGAPASGPSSHTRDGITPVLKPSHERKHGSAAGSGARRVQSSTARRKREERAARQGQRERSRPHHRRQVPCV